MTSKLISPAKDRTKSPIRKRSGDAHDADKYDEDLRITEDDHDAWQRAAEMNACIVKQGDLYAAESSRKK